MSFIATGHILTWGYSCCWIRCQSHGASGLWDWGCWPAAPEEVVWIASTSKRRKMASEISSTTVNLVCSKSSLNWRLTWNFCWCGAWFQHGECDTFFTIWNQLGVQCMSNLLFISLVGPSLEDFNALPYE